jgi:phosphate transport system substrate-binding protein
MKKIVSTLLMFSALAVNAQTITAAGATFPYPVYAKWTEAYKRETGVSLNYQSIGSSGGIRQINSRTVTFGATDAPVKDEELEQRGQIQFPAIIGGTVPIVNLSGFKPGDLRLTGPVLAAIYLGDIVKWNDQRIVEINPGKTLPDRAIVVVHRSDGSGTTFNFTDYLNTVSKEWQTRIGKGATVKWIPKTAVGGRGNAGVAANVQKIQGSIGYVEYAYVKPNKLNYVQLQNRSGVFVHPTDESFAAAAAGADWFSVPGMALSIVDQLGQNTWPISTASFIIMYKEPSNKQASDEALKFFDWAFKNGAQMSRELDYVHLPVELQNQIRSRVWSQIK